ncbi:GntR family transcriptional regulator [Paracoccus sp. MC1854]|uniref:GntR family transcriptional regulator n=1 Tax=Paracoccus sp. MC1854 TaxID=2760306 RepID=UPI001601CCBB|nr:GntR family transcriptional regulator [Paracoccus sp. MC1854]MBB1493235.1 GntR family transcriptional regulator [Paracoccus sp. MC1854]
MHESLRERVVKQLKAEIIAGESPPGLIYSVPSLAAELDVSTTPVREALLELSSSGLVEPIRNRGFRVSRPSLKELRDLFHMRDLLETEAARLMMIERRIDAMELYKLAEDIERAVNEDDVRAYLLSDRAFHDAMFVASGNDLLAHMALSLRDRMRLFGIRSAAGLGRQRESISEHYQLIGMIESNDSAQLIELLRHHILSWQPIFEAAWSTSGKRSTQSRNSNEQ